MGKIFRWAAVFLSALALTAIFEPPLTALFAKWGWHERPDGIPSNVLNWLASIVGESIFSWLAGGVIGFSAGLWVHHWASRFDRTRNARAENERDKNEKLLETARVETLRYCEAHEPEQWIEEFFYTQPWFHDIKENLNPGIVESLTNRLHIIGSPAGAHIIDPKAHAFLKALDDLREKWRKEGKIK